MTAVIKWDGVSADAADSTADNVPEPTGDYLICMDDPDDHGIVWPDSQLGRKHQDCDCWSLCMVVVPNEDEIWAEPVAAGMSLSEAWNLAEEMGCSLLG